MTTSIPQQYQSLKTKFETIVKKIISPSAIGENEDLNDYTEVGMYYCKGNETSQTVTNNPTSSAFSLLVEKNGVGNGVKQTYTTFYTNHRTYVRTMYTDDWTDPSNPTDVWGSWYLYFEDTGWKDVSFSSGFAHHSETDRVRYRRVGKVVELRGAVKNTKQLSLPNMDTSVTLATISDTSCRPSKRIMCRQQGSQMNTFLLTINTSGAITLSRYGTTSVTNVSAGAWLNVTTTFLVD